MTRKKIDVKEHKELYDLMYLISKNKSNAVSTIDEKAKEFLKEQGYKITCSERKELKWQVIKEEKDLKPRRIVSTGRKPISEEKVKEIRQKRLEGHSMRSIARIVGVNRETVKKYIKDLEKNGTEEKRD